MKQHLFRLYGALSHAVLERWTCSGNSAARRHRLIAAPRATVACLLLVATYISAIAQGASGLRELQTAERHAVSAADTQNLQEAKTQLQEALNCLVGRDDPRYRSNVGDPCHGESAMQNLPRGSANRIRAEKATRLAAVGVTFHDFNPAHYTAKAVQAVLEEALGR